MPIRSAFGLPVHVAASRAAPFSTSLGMTMDEYIGSGMTETFQVRHLLAHLQRFAVLSHSIQRFLGPSRTGGFARNDKQCALFCRMRPIWQWLTVAVLAASGCGQKALQPSDFAAQRRQMVERQLMTRGINDQRVLAAMAKVPREEFVTPESRSASYEDGPLPIGYGQTISQPYIVAFMTEQLRPKPSDRVLEIGTGSGYHAAILAELVKEIYSVEIVEPLSKSAEATLARLGYTNIHIKAGDGYKGWPEESPFDAIIVTCAPAKFPRPPLNNSKKVAPGLM